MHISDKIIIHPIDGIGLYIMYHNVKLWDSLKVNYMGDSMLALFISTTDTLFFA